MAMTVRELQIRRETAFRAARAVYEKAESEAAGGRDMSAAEQKEFDRHTDEVAAIDSRMSAAETLERFGAPGQRICRPPAGHWDKDGDFHASRGANAVGDPVRFTDERGQVGYLLERGQKVAELPGKGGSEGRYSGRHIGHYIRACITGDWKRDFEQFSMSGNVNSLGGYLVPDEMSSEVIDLARAQSVLQAAGSRSVVMDSDTLKMATLILDPAVEAKGENSAFVGSDAAFSAILFCPKTFGTIVRSSMELATDSPNFVEEIQKSLAAGCAAFLDKNGLVGTGGANQFLGIQGRTGLSTVTSAGSPTSYAKWLTAAQKLWDTPANVLADEKMSYILSPRDAAKLAGLTEATTNGYLQPPWPIAQMDRFITSALPITQGVALNESSSFVGRFQECIFALRTGAEIRISDEGEDAFQKYQLLIRLVCRVDFNLARPARLCEISGILA